MLDVRRREVLTLLGGAAAAWPLAARAQQPAIPVVGVLSTRSAADSANAIAAFHSGMKETGFVDGQTVAVEYRWAESQHDRLLEVATERGDMTPITGISGCCARAASGHAAAAPPRSLMKSRRFTQSSSCRPASHP